MARAAKTGEAGETLRRDRFAALAAEMMLLGRRCAFVAGGSSMEPFIPEGTTVVIGPAAAPAVGDIILFEDASGGAVLHRIVRKYREGVITRGDSCRADDGLIPCGRIIGTVVDIEVPGRHRHLRFPWNYLIARGGPIIRQIVRSERARHTLKSLAALLR